MNPLLKGPLPILFKYRKKNVFFLRFGISPSSEAVRGSSLSMLYTMYMYIRKYNDFLLKNIFSWNLHDIRRRTLKILGPKWLVSWWFSMIFHDFRRISMIFGVFLGFFMENTRFLLNLINRYGYLEYLRGIKTLFWSLKTCFWVVLVC